MRLTLNGEPADLAAETLAALLGELDLADAVVATALNGEFVSVRKRAETPIRPGDRVEIVAPMQGG